MVRLLILLNCLALTGCAATAVGSIGVWVATGKSTTDHGVGWAINRDCKTTRVLDKQMPCQDRLEVYNQHSF